MSWSFKAQRSGVLYDIPSYLTCEFGYSLSDVSGYKMVYSKGGVNAAQLLDDTVIIAYWNGVEPFNSRWILRGGEDQDQVEGEEFSIIGKSILDVFRKAVVHNTFGNLVFTTATPGGIMKNLIDAAQARGALTGITYNFTAALDSNGVAWAKVFNIEYAQGLTYLAALLNMFDKGLAEFRMNGTQLQMFNPDAMGVDRSTGAGIVELQAGRDIEEAPMRWSSDDKVKRILVVGDDDITVERTSTNWTGSPFGDEEGAVSQGGTKDTGLLNTIGDFTLAETELRQTEFVRKIIFHETSKIPAVDYQVGDWIRERLVKESIAYRVRAVVITSDGPTDSMSAAVLLNDQILEGSVKNAKRVEGIIGGAGGADALPGESVEPVEDTTVPNAPSGLLASSSVYFDNNGVANALASIDWSPPTTNVGGSALADLQDYELQWKYSIDAATAWRSVVTTSSDAVVGGLIPGLVLNLRVAARDSNGHVSDWTATVNHTLATDGTPPNTPSTPATGVYLGVVRVTWDGLTSGGGSMPVDFDHVRAYRSDTSGFTPSASNYFGRLSGPGTLIVSGQPYDVPWYYKFIAYDKSGNASGESVQASATTTKLVSGDLATGVAGNKVYYSVNTPGATANTAGDIWWQRNVSDQIVAMWVGQGGTSWVSMPYTNSVIANLDAGKVTTGTLSADRIGVNSLTGDKIAAGTITAVDLSADAIDGKTINGVVIIGSTFKTDDTGERIEIIGGTGTASDNEIRFYIGAATDPHIIRGAEYWGGTLKNVAIESPIEYYTTTAYAGYYASQMYVGQSSDLGDIKPGIGMYVLGHANLSGWSTGDQTPSSWVILEDDKVWILADSEVVLSGNVRFNDFIECFDMRDIEDGWTDSSAANVTSTTGVAMNARGGGENFVAPPSGIVTVHFSALLKAPSAGTYIATGVALRTGGLVGSGTLVQGYNYYEGAEQYNAQYATVSNWIRYTGLTPGSTYNVQQLVSVQSGTGSCARGRILIHRDF